MKNYKVSNLFRLKIAYSFLLNCSKKILNIRADSTNPGMTQYEVNFLHLVSEISNGTIIKINQTGTGFTLIPGTITNNSKGLILICLYGKEWKKKSTYKIKRNNK